MKNLLCLLLISLFMTSANAEIRRLEYSYEMDKLKAEFYQTTQKGLITPINCLGCEARTYPFTGETIILRNNQKISIETFMADYWNAKYPTIFLDLEQSAVIRIVY